jgi:hypothetical protein
MAVVEMEQHYRQMELLVLLILAVELVVRVLEMDLVQRVALE